MQCEFIKDLGMKLPKPDSPKKYRYCLLRCGACGKEFESQTRHHKKSGVKSCRECSSGIRDRSAYHRKHGGSGTRLYTVWAGIKARCSNPGHIAYHNYGGRGIRICEEWSNSFEEFAAWALANGCREGLDIDRIDNDGHYEPSNCRFVSREKNLMNQRGKRKNNTTGYTGVFDYGKTGRFYAKIHRDGKPVNLGVFDTKEEAHNAYQRARLEKSKRIDGQEG